MCDNIITSGVDWEVLQITGSDYCIIDGNLIANNTNDGAGDFYAITIEANCTGTYVTGNLLFNNDQGLNDLGAATVIHADDTVYGVGWDGDLGTPTKNAVYDKIKTMGSDIQCIAVRLAAGTVVNRWTSTPIGQMEAIDQNAEIGYTGHAPADMEAMVNPNLILSFSGAAADEWTIDVKVNSAGHGDAQGNNLHNGAETLTAGAGATFYTKTVALVGTISPSDIIGVQIQKTSSDAQVLYMSLACWIERA